MERLGTRSLAGVQLHVRHCLGEGDFSGALDIVREFVELVINDPRATARVFASPALDGLCRLVGAAHLQADPPASTSRCDGGTVLLLTEALDYGGHVELARDLLACGVLGECHLVLTDTFARSGSPGHLADAPTGSTSVVQAATSAERLARLVRRLRELDPAKIVLLTHHQDSVALAALHALGGSAQVLFVHHADHNLCLGASERDFMHVDLHPMGFHACRRELHAPNVYWPLTAQTSAADAGSRGFLLEGTPLTCSSGREAKFDASSYLYDYAELLPRMLQATGGRHLHIGPMSAAGLARIRDRLADAQIDPDRFRHIPWVPSLGTALVDEGVDLYVSSFPLGGGKAALECMAAGIPLLMHDNYRSRLLGGADLAYEGAFVWRTPAELEDILRSIDATTLLRHSRCAREHFRLRHSPSLFGRAVASSDDNAQLLPALRPWIGDELQSFLDERERDALDRAGDAPASSE